MDFYLSNVLKSVHITNRNHKDKMGVFFLLHDSLYTKTSIHSLHVTVAVVLGYMMSSYEFKDQAYMWVIQSLVLAAFSILLTLREGGKKIPNKSCYLNVNFTWSRKVYVMKIKGFRSTRTAAAAAAVWFMAPVWNSEIWFWGSDEGRFTTRQQTFPKGNIFNEPVVILSMENPEWQWGKPVSARFNRNCLLYTSI